MGVLELFKKKRDLPRPSVPENGITELGPPSLSSDPTLMPPRDHAMGGDIPAPSDDSSPFSLRESARSGFETATPQSPQPSSFHPKESELINAKLDTIKAMLENILQRLDKLDKPKW